MNKKAYIFLHIEIDAWDLMPHSKDSIPIIIDYVKRIIQGGRLEHKPDYKYTPKLLLEARKIMYLTDISIEDMVTVLDTLFDEYRGQ